MRPISGMRARIASAVGRPTPSTLRMRSSRLARMADTHQPRNPPWSRDELILALNLCVASKGNPPGKNSEGVVELSNLLNKMDSQIAHHASDFRNPNGVYMKVMNFRRFDPVYIAQGKKGLQRGNQLEEEVWNNFANHPEKLAMA